MLRSYTDMIFEKLIQWHLDNGTAEWFTAISDFLIILIIGCLLYYLAKWIIRTFIKRIAKRTKSRWDDVLLEKRAFNRLAFLIPGILIYNTLPQSLAEFPDFIPIGLKLTNIYIILVFLMVINSFFNAIYAYFLDSDFAKFHPIKSYVQVGKIIVFVISTLLILSYLFNQSPTYLLTGLGAFSAIVLLIFKDPILGFVGGIQLSANDMVRQGDWISMPKYSADGTVQEISLTTVKVQNWDNTITTLPTYSLVAESFQNYRGMQESGARRMKRSIAIDMSSVAFCTDKMISDFKKIQLVTDYITTTAKELSEYNDNNNIDNSVLVNGKRQTNLGIFRAYLVEYLKHHPLVHQDMDLLVRQLQPTSSGIPIEVYAFTMETKWVSYEKVQSDIFDHILAIVPQFHLRVFQSPTGEDLRKSAAMYSAGETE